MNLGQLFAIGILALLFSESLNAQQAASDFAKILDLAGWDEQAFAKFENDGPLTPAESDQLLPLLNRLATFDALSLARWTTSDTTVDHLLAKPADFQTQLVHLRGVLNKVEILPLSNQDVERFGISSIAECRIMLDGGGVTATVLAVHIPEAWNPQTHDEPVSFAGLVIKRIPVADGTSGMLFITPRVAWHPHSTSGANRSFGRAVLGGLRYDVGLLDDIENRSQIRREEREAFYQLLAASASLGSNQLIRSAQRALPQVAAKWKAEADTQTQRGLLAQEVVRLATEKRYSVAPLFNDAANQIGNLVTLAGVIRRAVKINVGTAPNGQPSDVSRRFGLNHYYEIDLFTDDSQDYPVVFCTPELPEGFPVGNKLHEPVQLAGFFFKTWRHHTRRGIDFGKTAQQLAPLMIGPMPVRLEQESNVNGRLTSIVASVVFIVAIVGVWLVARWTSRGDAQFSEKTMARQLELPEGESLNELLRDTDSDV